MLVTDLNIFEPMENCPPFLPTIFSDIDVPSSSVPLTVKVVELWLPPSLVKDFYFSS